MSSEEKAGTRKFKRQSATFCGGIIEKSPIPMLNVTGSKHIVSKVNDAFCNLVEKKREDLIGFPFADAGSIMESCISTLENVYRSGKAETYYEEKDAKSNFSSRLYTMWPILCSDENPPGIMIQIMAVGKPVKDLRDMNEALMLSAVLQHEQIESDRKLKSALQSDIASGKLAEDILQKAKSALDKKVRERTTQLANINKSLLTEIEEHKRTEKRLRSARKNLRAMAAEIVMADERSRQHFASDLHDTVIQTIGAAKLRSQLMEGAKPEKASEFLKELQDLLSQAITQARFIMAEMSPPVLNELGFMAAIEWLTEQIENQHGIKIELQAKNGLMPLQHEIQVLLFQATRELLMNVVKHSKAEKAFVKLSANKQKVRIEVIDDGKGFDKRQAFRTDVSCGGFGLFSIRERIRHFGGHLFIQSEEGKGTRVVMMVPPHSGGGGGQL